MLMGITDPEARITQYCSKFFNRLASVGYAEFRKKNPERIGAPLMKSVHPVTLKIEIKRSIDMKKPLKGHSKIQRQVQSKGNQLSDVQHSKPKEHQEIYTMRWRSSLRKKVELPLGLLMPHRENGMRHLLSDYCDCPNEKRRRSMENRKRKTKKRRKSKEWKTYLQIWTSIFWRMWS